MADQILKAVAVGVLDLGGVKVPCAVLENKQRVLSMRMVAAALGASAPRRRKNTDDDLPFMLTAKNIKPYVSRHLTLPTISVIQYQTIGSRGGGPIAHGIEATILVDICNIILAARDAGDLYKSQEHIAAHADVLVRAFAKVGIIGLVDEAAKYQEQREPDELQQILDSYVSPHVAKWVRTFSDDFYREIFRLKGWDWKGVNRMPGVVGYITLDLIYKRLAPGVLQRLDQIVPRDDSGRLRVRLFQHMTVDYGYIRLREILTAAVMCMRHARTWERFLMKYDQWYLRLEYTMTLPLLPPFDDDDDEGDN